MNTHYVYRINDPVTREFYIGVRTCEGSPDDDSYMGSYQAWKPEDETRLQKTILRDYFATRTEANICEQVVIGLYVDHPLNRNAYIPGVGFCMYGLTHSEETKQRMREVKFGKTRPEHSKSMKGENNPFYGKGHLRTGENNYFFEKTHSEEAKKKIRESWTDERRKKQSDSRKGETHPLFGKGYLQTGENNPSAKLTWDNVSEIRRLYATGRHTYQALADLYGVSFSAVGLIINNKTWKQEENIT